MFTAKPSPTLSFPNPSSNLHFFPNPTKHPSSHLLRSTPLSTPTLTLTPSQARVEVLSESLPYIQKFRGKTIVVKYGGAAMKSESLQDSVIKDLVLLSCVGIRPVLVHGGGPEINIWLNKVNIQPHFLNGLRVTDAATMEIVQMVLVGKVNKGLVSLINKAGATAVGLAGIDGYLLTARQKSVQLGFVGDIVRVDASVLRPLVDTGVIPVIASVANNEDGQTFNINADTVAGEIAAALGAEKLILLTDIAGILEDKNDPSTLVKQIDIKGVKRMVEDGKVAGGMIPKVNCCVRSLAQGVRTTSIIDGRVVHLYRRKWIEERTYPHLTMVGQSFGSSHWKGQTEIQLSYLSHNFVQRRPTFFNLRPSPLLSKLAQAKAPVCGQLQEQGGRG